MQVNAIIFANSFQLIILWIFIEFGKPFAQNIVGLMSKFNNLPKYE